MRIEIFGEEEEKDEVLRLRLVRINRDGQFFSLQAVDADGEKVRCGNLLHIEVEDKGGVTFTRSMGVSNTLGLDLDESSQIKIG